MVLDVGLVLHVVGGESPSVGVCGVGGFFLFVLCFGFWVLFGLVWVLFCFCSAWWWLWVCTVFEVVVLVFSWGCMGDAPKAGQGWP